MGDHALCEEGHSEFPVALPERRGCVEDFSSHRGDEWFELDAKRAGDESEVGEAGEQGENTDEWDLEDEGEEGDAEEGREQADGREEHDFQVLIPGLPCDLARRCLAFVPRRRHSAMRCVSRAWARELRAPEFYELRREMEQQEEWLVLLAGGRMGHRPLRLEAFDPAVVPQPSIPSIYCPHPARMLCLWGSAVLSAGNCVYLLGGATGTESYSTQASVWRYDGIRARWQAVAPMLEPRSNFACGVVGNRFILVAGGWGLNRQPLSSADVYDSWNDRWHPLPPMQRRRGSCLGVVFQGRFLVVSGIDKRKEGPNTVTMTLMCAEYLEVDSALLTRLVRECDSAPARDDATSTGQAPCTAGREGSGLKSAPSGTTDAFASQPDNLSGFKLEVGLQGPSNKEEAEEHLLRLTLCSGPRLSADAAEPVRAAEGLDLTPQPGGVREDGVGDGLARPRYVNSRREMYRSLRQSGAVCDSTATRANEQHSVAEEELDEDAAPLGLEALDSGDAWDEPAQRGSDGADPAVSGASSATLPQADIAITRGSGRDTRRSDPPGTVGAGGKLCWKRIEGMWRQVSLPGSLAVVDGRLFGVADIASGLREYDEATNLWTEVCQVPYPQKGFHLLRLNNGLLLLGVYGGHWLIPQDKSLMLCPAHHAFTGKFSSTKAKGPASTARPHPVRWEALGVLHSEVLGWGALSL